MSTSATPSPSSTDDATVSAALHERARRVVAGGVSSHFRLASAGHFFERGDGAILTDVDGRSFVDYALGMGPDILGHAAPAVVRAVAATLEDGQLFAGQHAGEVILAERLTEVIPSADLVRFGLTGSEMVQAAVRLARAFTGRRRVVKFEGHYHGWFDSVFVGVNPPLDGEARDPSVVPHPGSAGQDPDAAASVTVLPWNDLSAVERYLEAFGAETAALITEPIMCNTSVILPEPGYLEGLRDLCRRFGVLLVFDEVITGFRVALGGAQSLLGVTPDLAVFAKAIGGGFPLAVLAGRRDVMELTGSGRVVHGGTFNANVPGIAAGRATLEQLAADDGAVYRRLDEAGSRLMDGLRDASDRLGSDLHVQGVGAVFHVCFRPPGRIVDYRSSAGADAERLRAFMRELLAEGVRPTSRGTWFLSAAHTDDDLERTLHAAERALRRLG